MKKIWIILCAGIAFQTGCASASQQSPALSPPPPGQVIPADSLDKFPRISDEALLTKVQQQTFRYFWDFGHPVSGLARERNTSGDVVTSGGSGFGIMAIITGIHRNFITRAEGLSRLQRITSFLRNEAQTFHGAFPHWLNGATGAAVAFSAKDNGADLVETSYLLQGLLCARQYFNGADEGETTLRKDIDALWNAVEWSWFRKNAEEVLYWHWSPDYGWEMNHPVRGWNECLITYVLAASSNTYPIPAGVYHNGWARNGAMRNNNTYHGIQLPLGPAYGGPLFFAHYSFLGIDPNGLKDAYADYFSQQKNHALINYQYCRANPKNNGYSERCWGLTASDIPNGYTASSPTNDRGVIAPTAALSSFPYTPAESMQALHYFYYKRGDKLWKEYGFVDAFSPKEGWYAGSFLAIDQGPIIVMIENYRSGLFWELFMKCPEVQRGLKSLGFSSPGIP
ncbi:glucoamylase family protein [Chitinophaga sp. XS-30]|uniref:glucoamylase family protein n=1 Tax=Chitinophaga sp. XS-30 TaxID=2604421 RepID=UPI001FEE740D|nr:glucoamylase family protein [Chitinophaga sp. XS-30]